MPHDSISFVETPEPGAGNEPTPLSNTGVTGKISCSIDWIRYSAAISGLEWCEGHPVGVLPDHELFVPSGEIVRPLRFYDSALALVAGRVDWHSKDPEQGVSVSLTGLDCQRVHSAGYDLLHVLSHALYGLDGGNITRLDFAVDVFDLVDPQDIERAWLSGRVKCPSKRAKPIPEYDQNGELLGYTFYIGSRASERLLRVYDKAKREGLPGTWVRIELETKGLQAVALAKSMLIDGVSPAGLATLREFIEIEGVKWFTDALAGPDVPWLEPIVRAETDRQRWYREQILPALDADLLRGDRWVAGMLQAVLDEHERVLDGHGGVLPEPPPLENSPKWLAGVQVLEREFGLVNMRVGFRYAGKDACLRLLDALGYRWDKSGQKWVR